MDLMTQFLAYVAALSLATERIAEMLKGTIPLLGREIQQNATAEGFRRAGVQLIAVLIGSGFALLSKEIITETFKLQGDVATYLMFGAMASGGSGFWNSLLDISREIKKQREALTATERQRLTTQGITIP